jgi:hypothetical protein
VLTTPQAATPSKLNSNGTMGIFASGL